MSLYVQHSALHNQSLSLAVVIPINAILCDTQEALYDTPSDGKVLTPKGSLYRHKEYDDVADRPYEAPPKKESKIYDYLQRKDLFKLKRDDLK